jgi:hypothetical protein
MVQLCRRRSIAAGVAQKNIEPVVASHSAECIFCYVNHHNSVSRQNATLALSS